MKKIIMDNNTTPLWRKKLEDINESSCTTNLGITISSLFNDMENYDKSHINKQLALIDVSKGNPAHLVAILSTLFTWRDSMSNWKSLRAKMVVEFKKRKIENVEEILKGLL